MPVKGVKQVQNNVTRLLADVSGPMSEKAVTEIMITGMAYAAEITPIDTSTLINSSYRKIYPLKTAVTGVAGYAASYAKYVNDARGTLVHTQRPDGNGYYWDPNAEPDFLKKGFERDGIDDIKEIIKENYKL